MKQSLLHATAELRSDADTEATEALLRSSLGAAFTGKQTGDGEWLLSRLDKNFFRPSVRVRLEADGGETVIRMDCRPDKTLMVFMLVWTAILLVTVLWKGWLMLVMLPVFWACVLIGFPVGVKSAKQALIDRLSAYEVLD